MFSDLVKTKNMSLTSEEPNADHESSNEHFFIKEDTKDQRSDDEEDESKDENENKPDISHANIFAALAALQTGQLTLSQVILHAFHLQSITLKIKTSSTVVYNNFISSVEFFGLVIIIFDISKCHLNCIHISQNSI